jgi:hypothetical protein
VQGVEGCLVGAFERRRRKEEFGVGRLERKRGHPLPQFRNLVPRGLFHTMDL